MTNQRWQDKFYGELSQAIAARAAENEGKARVCARRAAGVVIGEYLKRVGDPFPSPGAYDRLRYVHSQANLSEATQEIISHFLTRINTEGDLPIEADLILDAQWLAEDLLHE